MGAAAIPLMVAGGGISAYGAIKGGQDQSNYYSYLAGTSKINADLAKAAGESTVKSIGAQEYQGIKDISAKGKATVGAQKAAMAASGTGVGSKTSEQIVSNTMSNIELDEQALRYNADLQMKNARIGSQVQALNYESQAAGYKMAGSNALSAGKLSALGTILGTGGQVASQWLKNKSTTGSGWGINS